MRRAREPYGPFNQCIHPNMHTEDGVHFVCHQCGFCWDDAAAVGDHELTWRERFEFLVDQRTAERRKRNQESVMRWFEETVLPLRNERIVVHATPWEAYSYFPNKLPNKA